VAIGDSVARHAEVTEDLSGADVVVLGGETDLEAVAHRAPAAVLVVAGDRVEERCKQIYEATLFPRARIIGVTDPTQAIESIVFERDDEHEVIAMSGGEFGPRRARLGRGGIRALL
jgi:hypothetical protein